MRIKKAAAPAGAAAKTIKIVSDVFRLVESEECYTHILTLESDVAYTVSNCCCAVTKAVASIT